MGAVAVSQKGIDLINSGQDSTESRALTALLNTGQDVFDANSAVAILNGAFGWGVEQNDQSVQILNGLAQAGYLEPYNLEQQVPSEEFAPPQFPSRPTSSSPMTSEGVPSVLPTMGQTAQAESSGAIPSVLPGRPPNMGSPIEEGVKAEQIGAADKFKRMMLPRGPRA